MNDISEASFRIWFRSNWKGFCSWVEPSKGSTLGMADIFVMHRQNFVPIELKVGEVTARGLLKVAKIRPVQIGWHRDVAEHGGLSYFLVVQGKYGLVDCLFLFSGNRAADYLQPVPANLAEEIDPKHFTESLRFSLDKLYFYRG